MLALQPLQTLHRGNYRVLWGCSQLKGDKNNDMSRDSRLLSDNGMLEDAAPSGTPWASAYRRNNKSTASGPVIISFDMIYVRYLE